MKIHVPSKMVRDLGFRSKLEVIVNQQIVDSGIDFAYEGQLNKIRYIKPVTTHTYLADFLLSNGIFIEAKGRFTLEDRKKHLYIKEQFPIIDIRFLFQNSNNKINRGSKTTYADWCDNHGIPWAHKSIPQAWLDYKRPTDDLNAIVSILKGMRF